MQRSISFVKQAVIKALGANELPFTKNMCENFYEAISHVLFRMTGFDLVSEMQSIFGRSDITLTSQTDVYIFELKTVAPTDFEKGVKEAL